MPGRNTQAAPNATGMIYNVRESLTAVAVCKASGPQCDAAPISQPGASVRAFTALLAGLPRG